MIDLRHGDCLENYTNNLMKQQSMYVDKVMMEYLEKQGYEIKEPYIKCVEEIQKKLAEEGKIARCETFTRVAYILGTADIIAIPFIDNIKEPLSREKVKEIVGLDKDYI